jgi:hypothetical protein
MGRPLSDQKHPYNDPIIDKPIAKNMDPIIQVIKEPIILKLVEQGYYIDPDNEYNTFATRYFSYNGTLSTIFLCHTIKIGYILDHITVHSWVQHRRSNSSIGPVKSQTIDWTDPQLIETLENTIQTIVTTMLQSAIADLKPMDKIL